MSARSRLRHAQMPPPDQQAFPAPLVPHEEQMNMTAPPSPAQQQQGDGPGPFTPPTVVQPAPAPPVVLAPPAQPPGQYIAPDLGTALTAEGLAALAADPRVAQALEHVRRQERDRLYAQQTSQQQQIDRLTADATARQQAEQAAQQQAEEARERAEHAEMTALQRVEAELANQRMEIERDRAINEQERRLAELQAYRTTALAGRTDLHPELLGFVRGNTTQEVDASIAEVAARSATIVNEARTLLEQASQQQYAQQPAGVPLAQQPGAQQQPQYAPQQQHPTTLQAQPVAVPPGPSSTGMPPAGPNDPGAPRALMPQDIQALSPEQYAAMRPQLMAAQKQHREQFGYSR